MRVANRVQVCRLHQLDVLPHRRLIYNVTGVVMVLVQVGAFQANMFAVD